MTMIRPIRMSDLHKIYENETPDQRAARLKANQERLEQWVKSWNEFKTKHPDLADNMVCAA